MATSSFKSRRICPAYVEQMIKPDANASTSASSSVKGVGGSLRGVLNILLIICYQKQTRREERRVSPRGGKISESWTDLLSSVPCLCSLTKRFFPARIDGIY